MPSFKLFIVLLSAMPYLGLPGGAHAAGVDCDASAAGARRYSVLRGTERVGVLSVVERKVDETTTFCSETTITAKVLGFIPLYRYRSFVKEEWRSGRLMTLLAVTTENGTVHEFAGRSDGNRFTARFDRQNLEAPSIVATTQFFAGIDDAQAVLVDPVSGTTSAISKRLDLGDERVAVNGQERTLRHYRLSGDVQRDLWFEGTTLFRLHYLAADGSAVSVELGS